MAIIYFFRPENKIIYGKLPRNKIIYFLLAILWPLFFRSPNIRHGLIGGSIQQSPPPPPENFNLILNPNPKP